MGDVAFIILRRREGLFQTVYENEMANAVSYTHLERRPGTSWMASGPGIPGSAWTQGKRMYAMYYEMCIRDMGYSVPYRYSPFGLQYFLNMCSAAADHHCDCLRFSSHRKFLIEHFL